ncbi:hypothetical protein [Vibrio alginolyticus]|uniref:hypothetical protein n=1 Tax=Vibrio TaxID=662 RepID=UPI0006CA5F89|nr:hypothetical protein [Vibrio alginolyticus]KPM97626.1 hypothetical protein AOG25_14280 [Vibrio alginolyticus]CAH7373422.1 conserved hypothetical protein [Vibrio chagasii]
MKYDPKHAAKRKADPSKLVDGKPYSFNKGAYTGMGIFLMGDKPNPESTMTITVAKDRNKEPGRISGFYNLGKRICSIDEASNVQPLYDKHEVKRLVTEGNSGHVVITDSEGNTVDFECVEGVLELDGVLVQWVDPNKELPPLGEQLVCVVQHWHTKGTRKCGLVRVNESDVEYRTTDDNTELSYDWNVISWLKEVKQ